MFESGGYFRRLRPRRQLLRPGGWRQPTQSLLGPLFVELTPPGLDDDLRMGQAREQSASSTGLWTDFASRREFQRRRTADADSCVWDRLIEG